ncbi:hypothetical protein [Pontibacter sp. HSC-36F09]|nr:hypothetical protein [Pontibacter sp. HSC-36F09]MCP2045907.1 hypothetical protein [Pontibacter sp. HSC-36F09]
MLTFCVKTKVSARRTDETAARLAKARYATEAVVIPIPGPEAPP